MSICIDHVGHLDLHIQLPSKSMCNTCTSTCTTLFFYSENAKQPTWNFWKYLVDENGHVVEAWGPWISVEDITQDVIDVMEGNYSIKSRKRGEL